MNLLLLSILTAQAPVHMWTAGDLSYVRAAPDASATPVARLRINSRVRFLDERGEWVRVSYGEQYPRWPMHIEGWVHSTLLSDEHTTVAKALFNDELKRARAVNAADPAVIKETGRAPSFGGYLAGCDRNFRAVLLGELDAEGRFKKLIGVERAKLVALQDDLSATNWFVANSVGSRPVQGTPFARSKVTPILNNGAPSGEGWLLNLGSCVNPAYDTEEQTHIGNVNDEHIPVLPTTILTTWPTGATLDQGAVSAAALKALPKAIESDNVVALTATRVDDERTVVSQFQGYGSYQERRCIVSAGKKRARCLDWDSAHWPKGIVPPRLIQVGAGVVLDVVDWDRYPGGCGGSDGFTVQWLTKTGPLRREYMTTSSSGC